MASLLSKFRIAYSDLTIITDIMKKASDSTKKFFDEVLEEYKKNHGNLNDDGNNLPFSNYLLQQFSKHEHIMFARMIPKNF